jgi:hypothetical protein
MSGRLSMELSSEPVDRVAAEVAVGFCFEDDRPLRGPAGRADWRLCGDLSRFVAGSGDGPLARALLLPTGGRLRAGRFLLLGLGASEDFGPDACARAVQDATRRLLDLRVRSVAMGPPGDWIDRIPVGIGAQACVRGAVAALEGTGGTLEVRLVTPPDRAARVLRGLEAAAADMGDRGVSVTLPRPERAARPTAAPAARPRPGNHPQA